MIELSQRMYREEREEQTTQQMVKLKIFMIQQRRLYYEIWDREK